MLKPEQALSSLGAAALNLVTAYGTNAVGRSRLPPQDVIVRASVP
jgi:hypothetical protein